MEMDRFIRHDQEKRMDNHDIVVEEKVQIEVTSEEGGEDAEDNKHKSLLQRKVEVIEERFKKHSGKLIQALLLVLAAGYVAVVIAACVLNFHRAVWLLVLSWAAVLFLAWDRLMERHGDLVQTKISPIIELWDSHWFWIRWVVYAGLLVTLVCWVLLDTARQGTRQLVSLAGLLLLVLLMALFSKSPFSIRWRALLWGVGLQFAFGLLLLRTDVGLASLKTIGQKFQVFISYANSGAKFVFGEGFEEHFFAFKVMPSIVFISTVISALHHVGFLHWLIMKVGFVMYVTMGTSRVESFSAAGNVLLGQVESILLVQTYLPQLTRSEIHAVLTGGFASTSGVILGVYISLGVDASHLMAASVMSMPASLAISKVFWPETETPRDPGEVKASRGESRGLLGAFMHGACSAVPLVANITVSVIAFISILAFLDGSLSWLGGLFDYPQLSFMLICSYVFAPLAFVMGVSWEDSFLVGELIGIKTFFNELLGYERMSALIRMREAGEPEYVDNVKQYISHHSEAIATFALCGFSNFGSLGMTIGIMTALAPERMTDFVDCGVRALIAGSMACFMTACIAGVLYLPDLRCESVLGTLLVNSSVGTVGNASGRAILECCGQLYSSVTASMSAPLNTTALQSCCAAAPSTYFNCSAVHFN